MPGPPAARLPLALLLLVAERPQIPDAEVRGLARLPADVGVGAGGLRVAAPEREAPVEWLVAVRETKYSRAFLGDQLYEAETRRIGFGAETRRPELIRRTLLEVAGTVLTARLALRSGLACNLAGGAHHAHASFGSGFTILNDLARTFATTRPSSGC